MIQTIFCLIVFINVCAIYYFRSYSSTNEKAAFYSGITGLVCMPLSGMGLLLAATNIQGVHGNLGGYSVAIIICLFATCISAYSLVKLFFKRLKLKQD
ncbi:MAG: hypothetical protein KKE30_05740 [Gammaproteobacteria bacterium]|nr:hypothetical protein [Gammaproteobacteria bacterium]MBU1557010.1 hypothetical protein [Gammaproteobacteria bacterium]MBU2069730.1 hypothetical protein [Gammaproteobacteria bacterium]MBU2184595.1 hypothetical protein [Gammaproteobacteria bacterium]MBU2205277.1 hypothetical protein [Gammaproteobacteria bacterium]